MPDAAVRRQDLQPSQGFLTSAFAQPPGGGCLLEALGGRRHLVTDVAVLVDEEALEEGLVELAPHRLRRHPVQLLRLAQQLHEVAQRLGADRQIFNGAVELTLDAGALHRQDAAALQQLVARDGSGLGQVEQAVFPDTDVLELLGEVPAYLAQGAFVLGESLLDAAANLVGEVAGEGEAVVVVEDGTLDLFGCQMRQVAGVVLSPPAQEVGVALAIASAGFRVGQAVGSTGLVTALAPQGALEVVPKDAVALSTLRPDGHDVLHAIEQGLRDERRVAPLVKLALVGQMPGVVRILEHLVPLGQRNGLLGVLTGGARGQPEIGHGVRQTLQRVVTGGVQLPSFLDQPHSAIVNGDAVHEAPVDFGADIQVAELGAPDGAAILSLMCHFSADVIAAHADLDFVHDIGDGFHGVTPDSGAKVFLGGDQSDVNLRQLTLGQHRVGEVAEDA